MNANQPSIIYTIIFTIWNSKNLNKFHDNNVIQNTTRAFCQRKNRKKTIKLVCAFIVNLK